MLWFILKEGRRRMAFDVDAVLARLVQQQGSDLHLKVGRPPLFRLAGSLLPSEFPPLNAQDLEVSVKKLVGTSQWERLQSEWECDSGYTLAGVGRFRINVFRQQGETSLVARSIPLKPPTIEQMDLPAVLKDIVGAPQGLILIVGPTGSGKSTTLAAMIDYLNQTQPLHIITIEDPIEFVYTDSKCTISQRQLGSDVKNVHEALKRAMRQDPDCILVGEMRDRETIELAMHAAETGLLVFSTLHTNDAKQTLDRIIDAYPPEQHAQIRAMLALTLHAVISQRLLPRADGKGLASAMEVMINSPAIRELIAAGKTREIDKVIATSGSFYKMQTFNQSLFKLVQDKIITEEVALASSTAPGDLKLLFHGIGSSTTEVMLKPELVKPGSSTPTQKLQIKRDF
jgi:twitching motility protein PilT